MPERMTNDELRSWAIDLATTLAWYEDEFEFPSAVLERLDYFYARMPHLTREKRSDNAARLDA